MIKRVMNLFLVIVLISSLSFVLAGCGGTEILNINPNDYIRYFFSGYDGEGTASVVFDENTFKDEFDSKLEYMDKNTDTDSDTAAIDEFLTEIRACGSLNKANGLSNGEVVTLSWNIDNEYMESKYNVLLSYEDVDLTVEGLAEPEIEIRTITDPSEIGADSKTLSNIILDSMDTSDKHALNSYDEEEVKTYATTCAKFMFEDEEITNSLGKVHYFVDINEYITAFTWYSDKMDYSDLAYLGMIDYANVSDAWDSVKDLMIQFNELGDRLLNLEYPNESYHCSILLMNEQNSGLALMMAYGGEVLYDALDDETMQISENAKTSDISTWSNDTSSETETNVSKETSSPDKSASVGDSVVSEEPEPSTDQIELNEQTPSESSTPDNTATSGETNALNKAKSYLSHSSFSYSGLIDQLEYEGYSTEEATYGADNCGADWNEQALAKANSYLSHSAFSYSGLIDQLEFEGFTSDQATYGVNNCGTDWNEQAVKKAESYLSHRSFTHEDLVEQLEFEGFTAEQAEYGATQAGA